MQAKNGRVAGSGLIPITTAVAATARAILKSNPQGPAFRAAAKFQV